MTCDVFVVGSLHLDVVVDAPHLPGLDETVPGSGVSYQCGGKGGNQAAAAARLGANTAMAGRIGSDEFGKKLMAGLRESGVDCTQIQTGAGASGMSVAIVNQSGAYGAVIVSGENLKIAPTGISVPTQCRVLILQNEIPEAVNLKTAQQAKFSGAIVLLNAAPARSISAELMTLVDVLIVNRWEAKGLLGERGKILPRPQSQAQALQELGAGAAIITMGEQGLVCCAADGQPFIQKACQVRQISSHGAGDVFTGALATEIARGQGVEDAVRFAQAAAALHVSTPVDRRFQINRAMVDLQVR